MFLWENELVVKRVFLLANVHLQDHMNDLLLWKNSTIGVYYVKYDYRSLIHNSYVDHSSFGDII